MEVVVMLYVVFLLGGAAVGVSLIKSWPGRTPADPE